MKRKLLAVILGGMLVFSVFSGCGQSSVQEDGAEEPITLTCYSQTANYSGEMTGWFAQELLERFNVKVLIIPEADGVYDTRMEAGDLGDIVIWGNDGEEYLGAVEAGLLFDWNEDYLLDDYGPYIKEHMPYALEKNVEVSGGTLYGFGHNVATSSEDHEPFFYTWDIRWDLYKELGYPEVKDFDDYVELMVQMKEICPTDDAGEPTYAVSLWPDWDENMVMYVKAMATAYYGYDELGVGLYDVETGEFHDALEVDGPYLESLKFFNNLYQRDLLDPDSITQTYDEMSEKVRNGGTFFSIFNYSGYLSYNTEEHLEQNKMMLTFSPEEATPIVYGMNVKGGNRIWSIGAKTQYPELCMEIINWLATPEGLMTQENGPEGVCWYYDEEGYTYYTDLGYTMRHDSTTEFPEDSGYFGTYKDGSNQMASLTWSTNATNPDSNGERYYWETWASNQREPANETEADWREYTGADSIQTYLEGKEYKIALGTAYSEGRRQDELKVVWEQVIKAITDYSWRAMYAKSDKEFDYIVSELIKVANSYGYDQCVAWSEEEAAIRKSFEDELR